MAEIIQLQDLIIPIVRTRRRKSVTIKIHKAQAQVHAPMGVARSFIKEFVASKARWIHKHLAAHQQRAENSAAFAIKFSEHTPVRVFGETLWLRLVDHLPSAVERNGDCLLISAQSHLSPQQALFIGVRSYAASYGVDYFATLAARYSQQLGRHPKRISIKEYRSRWGSCNARQEVQFNWLIALAPVQAIEYVVVHELCHLIHFNHSPAFWSAVGQLMPDYAVWRRWFSRYGDALWNVLDPKNHVN
ncbi:MAG: SprT family zinc-dependent metalloprotease [Marinagarivorans sp.]